MDIRHKIASCPWARPVLCSCPSGPVAEHVPAMLGPLHLAHDGLPSMEL